MGRTSCVGLPSLSAPQLAPDAGLLEPAYRRLSVHAAARAGLHRQRHADKQHQVLCIMSDSTT